MSWSGIDYTERTEEMLRKAEQRLRFLEAKAIASYDSMMDTIDEANEVKEFPKRDMLKDASKEIAENMEMSKIEKKDKIFEEEEEK